MNLAKLALIGLVAALAACATAPEQIKIEGVSATESPSFTLVDARSMENVRGGFNENSYSVWWVYGDDKISPPPLAVMRSGLARALGPEFSGKTIKVEKLEVSLVRMKGQSRSSGTGYAPSSGSVGGDVLAGFLAGLLINAIEGAKSGPTLSTEMVLEVDGKKIEHWEREYQATGELDRRLAENLVKAVSEVALKIKEFPLGAGAPEDIFERMKADTRRRSEDGGRFRAQEFEFGTEEMRSGARCARYAYKSEDHAAQGAEGKVLLLAAVGYLCVHPQTPNMYLDFHYSERGGPQAISAELQKEGESFLQGAAFSTRN